MKTVIYADVLIFINIILNYFLLRATAKITSSEAKSMRFLAAAALGGTYSLMIFVDGIPDLLVLILNVLFSVLMVMIAFKTNSIKSFIKKSAAFFLSHTAFAGIMFLLCTYVFKDSAIYKNGAVYFDVDILTLTVSSIVCYGIISVISRFIKSNNPLECIYEIEIILGEKSVKVKALFDTGNALTDSFSGRPVVICETDTAEKLFPDEIKGDITEIKGFRLIPYSTVGGAGALPAFPIEKIEISGIDKCGTAEKLFVAVTDKKLISGDYAALIGMPVFDSINWIKNERRIRFDENNPKTERKNFPFDFKTLQYGSKLYKRSGNSAASADGRKGAGVPSEARRRG